MALGLATAALLLVVLGWEVLRPRLVRLRSRAGAQLARAGARALEAVGYDPGRERRAEQRARALLRSCVDEEEWAMYSELGFLRVWGAQAGSAGREDIGGAAGAEADAIGAGGAPAARAAYAYLLYPHKPIVAYMPPPARC